MSFKRWFAMGLLIVLASSFAASTGVMVVLREREEALRLVAEEALFKAREANQQLEQTLASQKGKSARVERDLLALERMNQLTLIRLKGLEKKMSRLQKEVTRERAEKQILAKERSSLNKALSAALSEKQSLNTQLNKIFARSPEEVDLGQIVVSATPPLQGKVLVVNDKFQFVVAHLGDTDTLNIGALLNVYRGDLLVGRVQVEQVREGVAACRILPEWTLQAIQEDDDVKEL